MAGVDIFEESCLSDEEDTVLITRFSQVHVLDENSSSDDLSGISSDDNIQQSSPDEILDKSDTESRGRQDNRDSMRNTGQDSTCRKRRKKTKERKRQSSESSEDEFVPVSSRKKRRVPKAPVALHRLKQIFCCALLCLSHIGLSSITTVRENFSNLSETMKSQFILNWLWNHHQFDPATEHFKFIFLIGVHEVCLTAWLAVLGFSKSTFYACRSKFLRKERTIMPRGRLSCGLRLGIKGSRAVAWLTDFAQRHADKVPDKLKFFLPSCLCRKDVYHYFVMDMTQQGEQEKDIISFGYFLKLWRKDVQLRNISIPKASRFSLCDTCMLVKNKIASAENERKRAKAVKLRDQHLVEQNEERQKYYKHITKARRSPKSYISLIIDGMDQAKTNLPHFVELSKTAGAMWKLKVHVTGVIAHGIGHFAFFDIHQWPHGSSLTITVLHNILKLMKEVPKVLYLQMDNCVRDNKNRFLLGYLCHLVEEKIFSKVKLSFLMVGHTHEDVDQMFSRFSVALKKKACLTLPKMMTCFEGSFSPKPQAILLNEVYNIGDWLSTALDSIEKHSGPHCYKITREENGKAALQYKSWSTDKEWIRPVNPLLLKSKPVGEPELLEPQYKDEEMGFLQEGVKKAFKFFRRDDDKQWWEELFKNGCIEDGSLSKPFAIREINQIQEENSTDEESEESDEDLKKIKTKSTPIPPVIIGKKRTKGAEPQMPKLQEGDMCLLNVPKYNGEWPQVAKVVEVSKDTALIHWYGGSKTSRWSPCTVPAPGERGKRIARTENVQLEHIWFSGFTFTPSRHLPSSVKTKIDRFTDF